MDKLQALKQYFGYSQFRSGQEEIIDALLAGRDVLTVMPTGAGKSLCFQLPAILGSGLSLVVSPLISLMKDQVTALNACGVPAAWINSSLTPGQQAEALRRAGAGRYKLIYVAPERLTAPAFVRFAQNAAIDYLIVDEAHCISQWGQDFRPSYLRLHDFAAALPQRPVLAAFTATATQRVRQDVLRLLELRQPLVHVGGFDRPNLYFEVRQPRDKLRELLYLLDQRPDQSGVVYCSTHRNVEEVCAALQQAGYSAAPYHAGLPEEERRQAQEDFLFDKVNLMVATNAFGMGIDKSNVSFVIHYNRPKDVESYYQEAGRAGRDGAPADCILLYAKKDVALAQWMINNSRRETDSLSEAELAAVKAIELDRLKRMTFYATTRDCLRGYILRYFGESATPACGRCGNCLAPASPARTPERRDEPDADWDRSEAQTRRRASYGNVYGEEDGSVLPAKARLKAERAARGNAAKVRADIQDEQLFQRLRQVRQELAREAGVPNFVVFSDATLIAMSNARPRTQADLRQISGVGEVKLERYGSAFLRAIREYEA